HCINGPGFAIPPARATLAPSAPPLPPPSRGRAGERGTRMANERARRLRREQADAEAKLWRRLRAHKLPGYWFRRQVPLGPYIVDFACLEMRLLIEVDGSQHADQVEHDSRRTAWLESQGFRVLRFWNDEVLKESDDVVETIWIAV